MDSGDAYLQQKAQFGITLSCSLSILEVDLEIKFWICIYFVFIFRTNLAEVF